MVFTKLNASQETDAKEMQFPLSHQPPYCIFTFGV